LQQAGSSRRNVPLNDSPLCVLSVGSPGREKSICTLVLLPLVGLQVIVGSLPTLLTRKQ
jgi:hypothetical protein